MSSDRAVSANVLNQVQNWLQSKFIARARVCAVDTYWADKPPRKNAHFKLAFIGANDLYSYLQHEINAPLAETIAACTDAGWIGETSGNQYAITEHVLPENSIPPTGAMLDAAQRGISEDSIRGPDEYSRPLLDSIHAIETLGLNTNSSGLPNFHDDAAHGNGDAQPAKERGKPNPHRSNEEVANDQRRASILKELPKKQRQAYFTLQLIQQKQGRKLKINEAFGLLSEDGIPDDIELTGELKAYVESGELEDYKLPKWDAWDKAQREARSALGEQRKQSRSGRPTGRSIVRPDEIE